MTFAHRDEHLYPPRHKTVIELRYVVVTFSPYLLETTRKYSRPMERPIVLRRPVPRLVRALEIDTRGLNGVASFFLSFFLFFRSLSRSPTIRRRV